MKKIYLWLIAALAVCFASCEKNEPYDTQSADDAPLILKPYNESGTGSFTYTLASPETPLVDSVTVTPSAYTTVNWYLEGQLVHTGTKINMCFLAGKYALTIEAVTTAGKRTEKQCIHYGIQPLPSGRDRDHPGCVRRQSAEGGYALCLYRHPTGFHGS